MTALTGGRSGPADLGARTGLQGRDRVSTTHRVLIAEDDKDIAQALERILSYEGYHVQIAGDGAAALEALAEFEPDCLVLDVTMPFVDGLTVCRRLRQNGDRTPVLMLTAREEVKDRVAGLDAGADDYLAKPFNLDELLARLRALLRRASDNDTSTIVQVGTTVLNAERHEVRCAGELIDVTRTEFELLHLLLQHNGIVLTRSVIYERVWGYDFDGESRSLDVHIGYLRRKLEEGGRPRVIQTVRGVGFVYRDDT